MNIREGKSIQNGIPTPDNPVEIVNIFEVNDIQYCDNIPLNRLIGITKEQFCEYEQLQQDRKFIQDCGYANAYQLALAHYVAKKELDKYKSIVENLKEFTEEEKSKVNKNCGVRTYRNKIAPYIKMLLKIKELEEGENND